jgi:hypothetical protein
MHRLLCLVSLLLPLALADAAASSAEKGGQTSVRVDGTVTLRVLQTKACKGTRYKFATDIACSDIGTFRGMPVSGKASYAWRWTTKGKRTQEVGNLGLNLGNGLLYLRLTGEFKAIGKTTTQRGVARTTGKVSFRQGSFAYKGKTATGTYSLDLTRNATTYKVLKLKVHAVVH